MVYAQVAPRAVYLFYSFSCVLFFNLYFSVVAVCVTLYVGPSVSQSVFPYMAFIIFIHLVSSLSVSLYAAISPSYHDLNLGMIRMQGLRAMRRACGHTATP